MSGAGSSDREDKPDREDEPRGWPDELFLAMKAGHDRFMQQTKAVNERVTHEDGILNPFVIFKSFVDTQLGTLVGSFRSLPDNLAELRSQMEDERQRRRAQQAQCHKSWTHAGHETLDHFNMRVERASAAERNVAFENVLSDICASEFINHRIPAAKVHALYSDDESADFEHNNLHATPMLSPGGACEYMRENGNTGYNQVATGNASIWRWPATSPQWLSVDWFKNSPYSPINIEPFNEEPDHASGQWRAAFEDLINVTLDKPMTTDIRHSTGPNVPGVTWMLSLHQRGVLPPQLPKLRRVATDPSEVYHSLERLVHDNREGPLPRRLSNALDQDLEALTQAHLAQALLPSVSTTDHASSMVTSEYEQLLELAQRLFPGVVLTKLPPPDEMDDMVSRLTQEWEALGLDKPQPPLGIDALHEPQPRVGIEALDAQSSAAQQFPNKVDVLSSLTTTTTTRLPDGTVTTKVVLKQRFADGREETQEKVHTYAEPPHRDPDEDRADRIEVSNNHEPAKKTGWFWR